MDPKELFTQEVCVQLRYSTHGNFYKKEAYGCNVCRRNELEVLGKIVITSCSNQSCRYQFTEKRGRKFATKKDCISSIMELALDCSIELPGERIGVKDVVTTLNNIRTKFQMNVART